MAFMNISATQLAWFSLRLLPGVLLVVALAVHIIGALRKAIHQVKELRTDTGVSIKKQKKELVQQRSSLKSASIAAPLHASSKTDPVLTEFLLQLSHGCIDAAAQLVLDMQGCGVTPAPCFFRLLFQHMARFPKSLPRTMWDKITEARGSQRDSLTECYRVQYLSRIGDVQAALAAFGELVSGGLQPDLHTIECLMVACFQGRHHEELKQLFNDLDPQNLLPTPVMYSVLISSYGQTGAVASGLAAFDQMKMDYANDPQALRLGYTSAIHAAARNQIMGKTASLFEEFEQHGLPLDTRLASVLLTTALQAGLKDFALRVAESAKTQQVQGLDDLTSKLLLTFDGRPGSAVALTAIRATLGA